MVNIMWVKVNGPKHDNAVKIKILNFLEKLSRSDAVPGLHIEPINHSADSRARTGRVDLHWRAALYKLDVDSAEPAYAYAGTWEHDEGTRRAQTRKLTVNPINGILEVVEVDGADLVVAPSKAYRSRPASEPPLGTQAHGDPYLKARGYRLEDLTEGLGFAPIVAQAAFVAITEAQLYDLADDLENEWQKVAIVGLVSGMNVAEIRSELGITDPTADDGATEAEKLRRALDHPATKMQFTFIEDDEELRRVIDSEDFGAWRVFLHPEQRTYAERDYNGPFRLTGGAGTGKTVVLLHRAKRLAIRANTPRVILTTFTTALSSALARDLERLDPNIPMATSLGAPGVLVRGIDACCRRRVNPGHFRRSKSERLRAV
ncbi:UvrD-helicase domain-containing protein [Microbacterium sp. HA-8]|uniref:UvrD-helicase domain-containing protein n=1 Tax=Microbacterium sp. HA-8 TaxID=3234200 RepID=UPI0038F69B69